MVPLLPSGVPRSSQCACVPPGTLPRQGSPGDTADTARRMVDTLPTLSHQVHRRNLRLLARGPPTRSAGPEVPGRRISLGRTGTGVVRPLFAVPATSPPRPCPHELRENHDSIRPLEFGSRLGPVGCLPRSLMPLCATAVPSVLSPFFSNSDYQPRSRACYDAFDQNVSAVQRFPSPVVQQQVAFLFLSSCPLTSCAVLDREGCTSWRDAEVSWLNVPAPAPTLTRTPSPTPTTRYRQVIGLSALVAAVLGLPSSSPHSVRSSSVAIRWVKREAT